MRKRIIIYMVISLFVVTLIGINVKNYLYPRVERFEVFAAFSGGVFQSTASREGLDDVLGIIRLERKPVFTNKDIEEYDWRTHEIKINRGLFGLRRFNDDMYFYDHRFFVVVANGKCIYYGSFGDDASKNTSKIGMVKTDVGYRIIYNSTERVNDKRTDSKILNALQEAKILKEE